MLSRKVRKRDRREDLQYEEGEDVISVLGILPFYRSFTAIATGLGSGDTLDKLLWLICCYLIVDLVKCGESVHHVFRRLHKPSWLAKKITDADQGPRCDGDIGCPGD